jgi:serine/threonine protein phosphatase PrpC
MPPSDAPRRLGVVVAGCTDVGRVRSRNEDAYLIAALAQPGEVTKGVTDILTIPSPPACLIVADGVGGSASGELASLLTLDTIVAQLRRQYSDGALTSVMATGRAMLKALANTNEAIYTHACNHPEHYGMATTVTLALTYDDALLVAQIGDSRAYLVHAGAARQLTKDQSLVQRLIDIGELTEAQAACSPRRNIILQALGSDPVVIPDLYYVTPEVGDVILLCSDGLSNYLGPSDIAELALSDPNMAIVCNNLIACANARGGDDNITVVTGRFEPAEDSDPLNSASPPSPVRQVSASPTLADRVRRWLR